MHDRANTIVCFLDTDAVTDSFPSCYNYYSTITFILCHHDRCALLLIPIIHTQLIVVGSNNIILRTSHTCRIVDYSGIRTRREGGERVIKQFLRLVPPRSSSNNTYNKSSSSSTSNTVVQYPQQDLWSW